MRISDWSSDVCSSDLRLGNVAGARIVGSEAERHAVEVAHLGLAEVAVAQEAQIAHAGMNVIALGRDVGDADVGVGGRGGEELHDADGTGLAARALVELRFLVALGADHQPVEAVPVTVFLKQHNNAGPATPEERRGGKDGVSTGTLG